MTFRGVTEARDWQRFAAKMEAGDSCWEWTAGVSSSGYGAFRLGGVMDVAHRVAYATMVAAIPEGMQVHHQCGNKVCVRPSHLELVTLVENVMKPDGSPGMLARKTHCVNGHEFSNENTYIIPSNGRRQCIACSRQRKRESRMREREEALV